MGKSKEEGEKERERKRKFKEKNIFGSTKSYNLNSTT